MRFGDVVKRHREQIGLSQADLRLRLKTRGFDLARSRISGWENKDVSPGQELAWNPAFLKALAESLETSEVALLDELGFPVGTPAGFTVEDMEFARIVASHPPDRRRRAVKAFLAILEFMNED